MIKSIRIENFRSWGELELNLSPGVTVLVGNSNQGKSNLLRAIDWVINNKPHGDSYLSHWAGDCKTIVSIQLDDCTVERERSRSSNLYRIIYNGKKDELKNFGSSVPEEIRRLLRIEKVNFHHQLDPPFLLDDSPSEVSRYLNRVSGLDMIDRCFRNIRSRMSASKSNLIHTTQELSLLEGERKKYESLEQAERFVEELEKLEQQIESLKNRSSVIVKLIDKIDSYTRELTEVYPNATRALSSITEVIEEMNAINTKKEKLEEGCRRLKALVTSMEEHNEKIIKTRKLIKEITQELKKITPKKCPLCGKDISYDDDW